MEDNLVADELTRRVQLKCLEALIEIKRICDKYKIQYYLIGGTALGAFRHKGFIPWDDDIDIGMPRKDYEKFLGICEIELGSLYYLQSPSNENEFVFPFTKIRINGTMYKEAAIEHINIHHGIFVDIFPLDTVPKSKVMFNVQKKLLKVSNRIRFSKVLVGEKTLAKMIFKQVVKLYPSALLKRQYEVILKMGLNSNSGNMGNLLSAYPYGTEIMKNDIFGEGKYLEFEGINLLVPEKIEVFLIQMYGENYNQLPPMEKRVTHKPSEVSGV